MGSDYFMLTYGFNLSIKPHIQKKDVNLKILNDRLRESWEENMPVLMACKFSSDNIEFIAPSFKVPLTALEVESSLKKIFPREIGEPVCVNNFREIKFKDFCKILCSVQAATGLGFIGQKNIPEEFFHDGVPQKVCAVSFNKDFKFNEYFPQVEFKSKDDLLIQAEKILPHNSLIETLKSDSLSPDEHYIIQAESRESAKNIVSLLATALYENKRLISKRVGWFSDIFIPFSSFLEYLIQYVSNTVLVFDLHKSMPKPDLAFSSLSETIVKAIDINNDKNTVIIFVDIGGDGSEKYNFVGNFDESLKFITVK